MDERGSGWLAFAGIMLIIEGVMRFFDAIWAFSYHGVLPTDLEGAIFGHSLKTYGWVYLVVAIILLLSGFGVFAPLPAGQVHRCRSPRPIWVYQLDLVDALLPDLVADLHRDRCTGHLRARSSTASVRRPSPDSTPVACRGP